MAKDGEKRKGFWDDEEESVTPTKQAKIETAVPQRTGSLGPLGSDQVDLKIQEAKVLLDQIHNLYSHYFNGIEKRPPVDKARLLETKVKEIERYAAATTAAKFKMSQFISQYRQFKDLWERKLRDKEK